MDHLQVVIVNIDKTTLHCDRVVDDIKKRFILSLNILFILIFILLFFSAIVAAATNSKKIPMKMQDWLWKSFGFIGLLSTGILEVSWANKIEIVQCKTSTVYPLARAQR